MFLPIKKKIYILYQSSVKSIFGYARNKKYHNQFEYSFLKKIYYWHLWVCWHKTSWHGSILCRRPNQCDLPKHRPRQVLPRPTTPAEHMKSHPRCSRENCQNQVFIVRRRIAYLLSNYRNIIHRSTYPCYALT